MTVAKPTLLQCHNEPDSYINTLKQELHNKPYQCVVAILPRKDKAIYNELKVFLCTQVPVPSQCIEDEKIKKGKSFATNVAVQVQCKLQGLPYKIFTPFEKKEADDLLMVVGIHEVVTQKS